MKAIIIILVIDAVISTIIGVANAVIKKDIDRTISECAHELRKSMYENDNN